ncbi:MAG: LysR family transcriptional regulator [Peptococcaceae bacterium]|nr:LysR family transcriptional regulator [Peptococcaceae bacterium]MBQ3119902.1 LysR family transcriptional regulator [Peptococcaceae bacterium]MBR2009822.1 LysR family transcriptional regulator [Peptococcaceae bacterium]
MKIEHLYYFLVIANTKSINKAARKLFVSQQHLSRIVNTLEEDLHIKLLNRTSTGIELTEKGKVFTQFAEKIVNDYREMQSYFYLDALPALDENKEVHGSCQIAFPFFFSMFLNDFIKKLHEVHPDITIRYFEDAGSYNVEAIRNSNMLHVVVESKEQIRDLFTTESGLTAYHIGDTGVSVCVNRTSPLASLPVLSQANINSQLATAYPQSTSNILLKNANILFVSSNIYQHLDSVVHNNSICIVASYIQPGIKKLYPDIVLLPFEREFTVPIHIMHNQIMQLTDADKAVIQFTAQYMQKLNNVFT